jgi:hypothetical protein
MAYLPGHVEALTIFSTIKEQGLLIGSHSRHGASRSPGLVRAPNLDRRQKDVKYGRY